jgi:hypothetical protein
MKTPAESGPVSSMMSTYSKYPSLNLSPKTIHNKVGVVVGKVKKSAETELTTTR